MKSLPPKQWPTIWGAIRVSSISCSRLSSARRWHVRTAWNRAPPLTLSSAFHCQSRGNALRISTSMSFTSASSRDRFFFLLSVFLSFFTNSSRFYGILPGDHKILVRIVYSSHSKVLSILQPVDTKEMRIVDNSSIWNLIHSSPLWHL